MKRRRIYIAGPITKGDLRTNIRRACETMEILLKEGYAPFCPQLSCYMGGDTPEVLPCGTSHGDWVGMDLPWVEVSEALLRLEGESKGADMEVIHAKLRGIPVFHSLAELFAVDL